MGVVQQPGPIERTHDNRLAGTKQNETDYLQGVVDRQRGLNPTTEQGVSKRRRDVEPKGRELERGGDFRSRIYDL